MNIRLAALTDVSKIMRLIDDLVPVMNAAGNYQWDNHYPNSGVFESDIAQNQLWLAEESANIAGIIAITTHQSPEYIEAGWDINERTIVVHRLAVNIHYQGKGIAANLMKQAEMVAEQRNLNKVRVDTNVVNAATNKLFPKLGYVYAGEISLWHRPGMRFNCYEKILKWTFRGH
jgi:ribosomal protein S18 acetylase RimI-like enzyme